MEFSGLVIKYPTDRPLTELERAHQLKQKVRLNLHPHNQLCVIKMNSTFLESVDKWFAWKGIISALASILIVMFGAVTGYASLTSILIALGTSDPTADRGIHLANGLAWATVGFLILWGFIWLLRKESFAFTHYPLRFNRKTRMVHVFQTDGSTMSVPWDDVFFTLGKMGTEWEVRGHVLDINRKKVRATFALSCVRVLSEHDTNPATTNFSDQDFVRGHWEFIRRYMEDGPRAVTGQIRFCMPVDGRRESAMGGVHRIFANFSGGALPLLLVMFPFCAVTALFRAMAMQTSKIPQWPRAIEEECIIEPDDPFAIRGDAQGNRVAVFPRAASNAGVRFVAAPPGSGT